MLCEYCEHDEEHHIIQEECVITGCTCFALLFMFQHVKIAIFQSIFI